ncbi:flagellar protein FlaG [Anaeromicropila herbilytica]|uniref:Flagellar protein FlaG n=1 Tax=Anaeromicropila herbilytica TaxID=2785025 RepID=A0A7R7IEZ7_9FIRM|nr:flagellar protein FlaG [Anaeromicropila herbilytica]BCN32556.1 hypothetical protein bsdtb5_38510 [Anaeromicropila herbilytica]
MALDAIGNGENYIKEVVKTQSSGQQFPSSQTTSEQNVTKMHGVNDANKSDEKSKDSNNEDNSIEKKIRDAVTAANNKLLQSKTRCEYKYHEDINRVSIKIRDTETDKIIKEIPAEGTLESLKKIWEIAGLLVDEKR